MKIQRLTHHLWIFCLSVTMAFGCTTQESPNPVTPEGTAEVVLKDHKLTKNETWTPEKTYSVQGTLEVPQNITLNVLPGTTVKFRQNALLTVRGKLKIGTPLDQERVTRLVHLTSATAEPVPGEWNGLRFDHTHDVESFIRGAVIAGATVALDIQTASPTITDCTLRHNTTGIRLDGSEALIEYNDILDNQTGLSTLGRQTQPKIEKNSITQNETGLFCENVHSVIQNNNLNANIFALRLNVKFDVAVPHNWWGSVDAAAIAKTIIDAADPHLTSKRVGTVSYEPFAKIRIDTAGVRYPHGRSDE